MYTRLFKLENFPVDQSIFLFGPRMTGKSTLIKTYLETCGLPHLIYDLLDPSCYLRLHSTPEALIHDVDGVMSRASAGLLQVHIDEVQKVPALLDAVHLLIEKYRGKVRFIMAASSVRKLKRGGANLLGGRAWDKRLYPLTSVEMGAHFSLSEALRFGTLPSVVDRPPDQKKEQLRAYVAAYLKEEIQAEALLRRLDSFHRFLEAAVKCNGELVNMTAVAQEAMVPRKTVSSYYQILEDTLAGFFLPSWGRRLSRKDLVTHGKFYFFDTGVVGAVNQSLDLEISEKNPIFGRVFEHFCVLEFMRIQAYKGSQNRIGFFRTRSGTEVDLIEESPAGLRAIEIKAMKTIGRAQLSGLKSFAEEFPQAQKVLVCLTPSPMLIEDVQCLPWRDFFNREAGY